MINSVPNNKNYNQGLFIPRNVNKVIKLNNKGGLYYRSGLELKMMTWLDNNIFVSLWGAECIQIPYQMTHFQTGDMKIKEHTYYPDFYYEMRDKDGLLMQVVAEVKPLSEYNDAIMLSEGKFKIPENATTKQLTNLEYKFKMAQKNNEKWKNMIRWCQKKGFDFVVITEKHFK